ncbi:Uncharacterized protein Rs2_09595 [Raphanus sativus]|nr:Uncharacterized protein Rs2_09595 [Raphanus sativus]
MGNPSEVGLNAGGRVDQIRKRAGHVFRSLPPRDTRRARTLTSPPLLANSGETTHGSLDHTGGPTSIHLEPFNLKSGLYRREAIALTSSPPPSFTATTREEVSHASPNKLESFLLFRRNFQRPTQIEQTKQKEKQRIKP